MVHVIILCFILLNMASAGTSKNPIFVDSDSNSDSVSTDSTTCVDMASPLTSRATSAVTSPESATNDYVVLSGLVFYERKP